MRSWIALTPTLAALALAVACSDGEDADPSLSASEAGVTAASPQDGSLSGLSEAGTGGFGPGNADAAGLNPPKDAAVADGGNPQPGGPKPDAGLDAGRDAGPGGNRDASSGVADAGTPPNSGNPAYPPITNGCKGFATRYWDCCKPHCGWTSNVSGSAPLATCNQSDGSLGADYNMQSSCQSGGAFMCQNLAPWAASAKLSFGFAAIAARGDICGKCYQLQFTGSSRNAGNDPGSAALAGKTMIVQATNVGGDVGSGQFDLLTPGGGVGAFNACSKQWGVPASELGAQYGGFLTACKQGGASDHAALKSCVMQRCTSVFGARGLSKLEAGCRWFVEWFEVADNPALQYKEVACPQELKGRGMNRSAAGTNACGV